MAFGLPKKEKAIKRVMVRSLFKSEFLLEMKGHPITLHKGINALEIIFKPFCYQFLFLSFQKSTQKEITSFN